MTPFMLSLSMAVDHLLRILRRALSQENKFRKPDWAKWSRLWNFKKLYKALWTCFSSTFDRVDNIDIGLKFPLSCRLPFLWIGTIFAIFHFSGTIPVLIDKFSILVIMIIPLCPILWLEWLQHICMNCRKCIKMHCEIYQEDEICDRLCNDILWVVMNMLCFVSFVHMICWNLHMPGIEIYRFSVNLVLMVCWNI